jgi:hypothetical protein
MVKTVMSPHRGNGIGAARNLTAHAMRHVRHCVQFWMAGATGRRHRMLPIVSSSREKHFILTFSVLRTKQNIGQNIG